MLRKIIEVTGDTLILPELKNFLGKKIEITLKEFSGITPSKRKNLKEFFGKLRIEDDALEIQKKMRNEWDKRETSF